MRRLFIISFISLLAFIGVYAHVKVSWGAGPGDRYHRVKALNRADVL